MTVQLPKVAIQDANILIDMIDIGLLDIMLELPVEFHVSDFVLGELMHEAYEEAVGASIMGGMLTLGAFDVQEVQAIAQLSNEVAGPSFPDCSCIFLAEKLGAALLTGDARLRREAHFRGLRVHGSLWILDQLLLAGMLDPPSAGERLLALARSNRRLPRAACTSRIETWMAVSAEDADTLMAAALEDEPTDTSEGGQP